MTQTADSATLVRSAPSTKNRFWKATFPRPFRLTLRAATASPRTLTVNIGSYSAGSRPLASAVEREAALRQRYSFRVADGRSRRFPDGRLRTRGGQSPTWQLYANVVSVAGVSRSWRCAESPTLTSCSKGPCTRHRRETFRVRKTPAGMGGSRRSRKELADRRGYGAEH